MTVIIVACAILLLVQAQSLLYKYFWARALKFSLNFSRGAAFEGEQMELVETVSNASPLPFPWVSVKFQVSRNLVFADNANSQVSDDYYRNDLFGLMMFQRVTRKLAFTCAKRGFYTIKSADLAGGGLHLGGRLIFGARCETPLTVYPKLIGIDEEAIPYKQLNGEVLARRFYFPDPFEFQGIRGYQPRDGLRSVNFKASAKAGSLMSNINGHTVSRQTIIALNLQPYSAWHGGALFEQAIRLAASLANICAGDGAPCRVISNGRDILTGKELDVWGGADQSRLVNVYEALARLDLGREAAPFAERLARELGEGGGAAFFLVSTYHGADLQNAFLRISENFPAIWVVPMFKDLDVKFGAEIEAGGRARKWVVADNEQSALYY